ncbi:MAG: glycoside hydrolase family 2 [Sphingobacteriales bacterium]|nr:glycoside hydrolase family 2 [Sphingobacteriales bacterium]
MKKIHRISAICTALFLACTTVIFSQEVSRNKQSFDEDWKFSLGHAADPAKDFNFRVANIFAKAVKTETTAIDLKYNDKAWRSLNVPHDWAVELPFANSPNFDMMSHGYKAIGGLFPENSIGWYRKHFTVAKADSGSRYSVQFDGIFRDAMIWVNGFYLGRNESGYIGQTYDITDFLNFNSDNVIVVRADASQSEGWFYEGAGIYRHVWLNKYNGLHIPDEGVFVHATVANNQANVSVETTVENQYLIKSGYSLLSYITDRNGKKIASSTETTGSLNVNEKANVKQSIALSKPRLWSLEDPYQYHLVSEVRVGNKLIDVVKTRFGVRTIEFNLSTGFFLNGKHIKIHGTNNHQDHGGLGSALPNDLQYYRIRLLKEMGVNAYRASHHAPTPELLNACDSLGMLVLDEQRILSSSAEYIDQFTRLIKRDRNHPSIFLWSIGNEEGSIQTASSGRRIAQTLLAKQVELDPTRTSTYAADLANVFSGVNEVIPIRGFNYRHLGVADYHRDHPSQPILGTEMGSTVTTRGIYAKDSVRAYVPDQDITAPWWASTAEAWLPLSEENPFWLGGFIWTGFDYRGEPTPYQWPNISSHFGVMDACGFPKNIYYYYQSWWTDKDVLHITPHWNWKGKEGKLIDVWVNSNADNVELFLNRKSLGKKTMPKNSHLIWQVPYHAGVLQAVGYKGGRKITTKVETTGEAYQLVLRADKTNLKANGINTAVINVSVVDKQGREVPDVNELISFSLTGDAKIIGVGNGDPSSHEADKYLEGKWQRKLFNGKCQVIIQAGKNNSNIRLNADSENLKGSVNQISISK